MNLNILSTEAEIEKTKPKVLMLLPGYYDIKLKQEIAEGLHPVMDYIPLSDALSADVIDYASVDATKSPIMNIAKPIGKDAQVAVLAFLKRKKYDIIFSYTDSISLPLAAFLALSPQRPLHILTAHSIASNRRGQLLRLLHRWIDLLIVYSDTVYNRCHDTLGVPEAKLRLLLYHTDHRFFHPMPDVVRRNQICSVGLEQRDYPTLIAAVTDLDVDVRLTAFSPWSRDANETKDVVLPPNVSVKHYSYTELRQLYAESRILVLPLYENQYAAGITALYEAMAMKCPAIVSRTTGLRNMIDDGINGLFVAPGDIAALRKTIVELLADPVLTERIGQNGRQTIEEHINIDLWVGHIVSLVNDAHTKQLARRLS